MTDPATVANLRAKLDPFYRAVEGVLVGQRKLIDGLLIGLLSDGHVLLEGVPGLAKTLAVRAVAGALALKFSRIQFTPDLLPADVIGTQIYNPRTGEFSLKQGPVFANVVLADEINRAPAKVQSALLEAMAERQVTIGEHTLRLPRPFFVLATQNPIEQEGTYPLPEAQLDRFMFNVKVEYPTAEDELQIVTMSTRPEKPELSKVLTAERIVAWQKLVKKVEVPTFATEFIVKLVRATRPKDPAAPDVIKRLVDWGAGPRAGIFLAQAAQAFAAMDGRPSVALDDIKKAAIPVLRHRVSANFQAQAEGRTSDDIVIELLKAISDPGPKKYAEKKK